MANYLTTDTDLTAVADAIRTKGGTNSALEWPTEYVSAIEAIITGTPRSAADLVATGSIVSGPEGYYSEAFSKAVSAGSIKLKTLDYGGGGSIAFNMSTGIISYDNVFSGTYNVSSFLSGYINAAPSNANYYFRVSASTQLAVFSASTWTPSSTNQYISSYQWLTDSQTILGDADLVPSNIKSGVSIFGINGIVEDLNDVPTIYCSNYGDTYSCNMTYNQIRSLINNAFGPILGIYVDENLSFKRGGSWNIEDDNTITFDYETHSILYHSNSTFEPLGRTDIPTIIPTSSTQYIYPEDPYWYFGGVRVNGDANLVASNIKSGVSIFGVQGTLFGDRSFENNIVQRKYISSYINNDISMIGSYAFAFQDIGYMECLSVKSIYSYAFQYAGYSTFSNGMSFPSCTSLGYGVFYCARMSKVSFPNCVTIPEFCFYSCSSLVEVSFPNCTRISQSAFYYATNLISADFSQVTSIQQSAFYGCSKLISISFPKCTYVGNYTFGYCSSLENIYLPMLDNSVYAGCMNVFAGCTNLSSINLPAMTQIGKYMFYSCVKLRNVSIPLCESIFDSAFKNCTSLSSISFSLCTGIWSNAFESCTNLIDVNLPVLISLQGSVFKNCTALESINLPLLQSLVTDTFFNCNNLKNVSFPVCSYFGTRIFAGCSSLAFNNIYAPNVTKIGASVFADCIGFSEVFYSSIVFDGAYAFVGCQNLTSVTLVDCPGIWTYTFASCYNLLSLYLLGSSVTALSNRSAFNSTPIFGYTTSTGGISGSIFVPASLYNSYISATNWTLLSSRFVSLTDTEIAALIS